MSRLIAAKINEDLYLNFQSFISTNGLTISECIRKFIESGINAKALPINQNIPTREAGGTIEQKKTPVAVSATGSKPHWFYRDHFYELERIAGRLFPEGALEDFNQLPPTLISNDGTITIRKTGNGCAVTIK